MLTREQVLEAIEVHGLVVGPTFNPGVVLPERSQARTGYCVYANWVDAADDTYAPHDTRTIAYGKTLPEAVEIAVIRLNRREAQP